MADELTDKSVNADKPLEKWQGHIKNIQPTAGFESEIKSRDLPAKQQAQRAAEIEHQNKALIRDKPGDTPLQPAMPLGPPKSVYPDSTRGVESSQSQTPRFEFDTTPPEDPTDATKSKSFFKKFFGRQ